MNSSSSNSHPPPWNVEADCELDQKGVVGLCTVKVCEVEHTVRFRSPNFDCVA